LINEIDIENQVRNYICNRLKSSNSIIQFTDYESYMMEQYLLGEKIIKYKLFNEFPNPQKTLVNQILERISQSNPYLIQRFPYVAAFGYSYGILIHSIIRGNENIRDIIGIISSFFNISISLFDYVIDEEKNGERIFSIVSSIFGNYISKNGYNLNCINPSFLKNNKFKDTNKLLFILINQFIYLSRKICDRSKNFSIWTQLVKILLQMFIAERKSYQLNNSEKNISTTRKDYLALRDKSVLPFKAFLFISQLSNYSNSSFKEKDIKILCKLIGNIFWLCDDLHDLVKDLETSKCTSITIKLNNFSKQKINFSTLIPFLDVEIDNLIKYIRQLYLFNSKSFNSLIYKKLIEFINMYIISYLS
jgi:hypothetical protein